MEVRIVKRQPVGIRVSSTFFTSFWPIFTASILSGIVLTIIRNKTGR